MIRLSRMLNYIKLKTELPGPRSKEVLARHRAVVARASSPMTPIVAESAHGTLLTDIDGNTFIDLAGGVGVLNVGHTQDGVVEAVRDQAGKFLHTDYTVVPYASYVNLAERLVSRYPGGVPAKALFFNSGAEAVENAVKIARVATGRKGIIAFEGAFHGRTLMAMSLTSKPHPYKAGMGPFASDVYRAPFPYSYRCPQGAGETGHVCGEACFEAVEQLFQTTVAPEEVAAIIVEPVQGEGGFVVPPASFLGYLRNLTGRHGILLIVDEVQTGFGRTGTFFAVEQSGVVPDLITVAKSIADGLPLSGVLGKSEVMDAPGEGMVGGTYVGNPVACRAGEAVLDAFESENLLEKGRVLGEHLRQRLEAMAEAFPLIGEVRGLGAMQAIELVTDPKTKEPAKEATSRVLHRALKNGVICLKAGLYDNVIRFLAPLNTPLDLLDEALDVLEDALRAEGV